MDLFAKRIERFTKKQGWNIEIAITNSVIMGRLWVMMVKSMIWKGRRGHWVPRGRSSGTGSQTPPLQEIVRENLYSMCVCVVCVCVKCVCVVWGVCVLCEVCVWGGGGG